MEVQRRLMVLQQRVNSLESENAVLKKRLTDLATSDVDVATYMRVHGLTDLTLVETTTNGNTGTSNSAGGNTGDSKPTAQTNGMTSLLLNLNDTPTTPAVTNGSSVPPVPPRSFHNDLLSELALTSSPGGAGSSAVAPSVGRKLEGLLLDDLLEDDFDPRAHESASGSANSATGSASSASVAPPLLAPPPQTRRGNKALNHKYDQR
ncbi:PTB domain-containing adapter protein ced-6-like [Diaphorina citri]|uniref:PTB domain-containing adapter protein ced-6-like n=1 Tax=Diaphorina citri TaxID=121845 RepID=A0A3Q0JE07_DIACI|nr:PTB domain-containing adapter protein ced-6-like [Diaphorina citri]